MKVLVVSHLFPHAAARTNGIFVRHQVACLARLCQVQVVSPVPWWPVPWGAWGRRAHSPRRERLDGVDVSRPRYANLPRRIGFASAWRRFARAVAGDVAEAPDVVHAHCAYPDGYAAAQLARRWDRPLVITAHGNDLHHLPRLDRRWAERIGDALRSARVVIGVSRELCARAVELGAPPEGVTHLPNGVDCARFDLPRRRSPGAPREVLYLGRFDPQKGLHVLLEAVALLSRQRRDFRLRLVGANPATAPADPFARQARDLGLGDLVSIEAEVPWDEVPARMAAADVFVLPSFSEGLPLALIEAVAAGTPVVATRCGGPEEVVDGEIGLLVTPRDVGGLAAALGCILDGLDGYDPQRLRARARSCYDLPVLTRQLHQIYQRLVGAG